MQKRPRSLKLDTRGGESRMTPISGITEMILSRSGVWPEHRGHATVRAGLLAPLPLAQFLARMVPLIVTEILVRVAARIKGRTGAQILTCNTRVLLDLRCAFVSALFV